MNTKYIFNNKDSRVNYPRWIKCTKFDYMKPKKSLTCNFRDLNKFKSMLVKNLIKL